MKKLFVLLFSALVFSTGAFAQSAESGWFISSGAGMNVGFTGKKFVGDDLPGDGSGRGVYSNRLHRRVLEEHRHFPSIVWLSVIRRYAKVDAHLRRIVWFRTSRYRRIIASAITPSSPSLQSFRSR